MNTENMIKSFKKIIAMSISISISGISKLNSLTLQDIKKMDSDTIDDESLSLLMAKSLSISQSHTDMLIPIVLDLSNVLAKEDQEIYKNSISRMYKLINEAVKMSTKEDIHSSDVSEYISKIEKTEDDRLSLIFHCTACHMAESIIKEQSGIGINLFRS